MRVVRPLLWLTPKARFLTWWEVSVSNNFKLCFIKDNAAYFTTAALKNQSGDDWDDIPYECNAGEPYLWHKYSGCPEYKIKKIYYDSSDDKVLITPDYSHVNSPYSIEALNKKVYPWLIGDGIAIFAGESLESFVQKIESINGNIYLKKEDYMDLYG